MLGDAMSGNAMLGEELEAWLRVNAGPHGLSSCRWPPKNRCWWMRIDLFTFTHYVQIVPFNLGRPGGHLRYVAGCEDVAAGRDVGRSPTRGRRPRSLRAIDCG